MFAATCTIDTRVTTVSSQLCGDACGSQAFIATLLADPSMPALHVTDMQTSQRVGLFTLYITITIVNNKGRLEPSTSWQTQTRARNQHVHSGLHARRIISYYRADNPHLASKQPVYMSVLCVEHSHSHREQQLTFGTVDGAANTITRTTLTYRRGTVHRTYNSIVPRIPSTLGIDTAGVDACAVCIGDHHNHREQQGTFGTVDIVANTNTRTTWAYPLGTVRQTYHNIIPRRQCTSCIETASVDVGVVCVVSHRNHRGQQGTFGAVDLVANTSTCTK